MKHERETTPGAGADKPASPAADSKKTGPFPSSQNQINHLWKISIIGAVGTIFIALLGLLGYIPHLSFLGAVHESFIPMAPSAAVGFVILGACLLGMILRPLHGGILKFLGFLVMSVSLFGVLEVVGHFIGTGLNFEDALVPSVGYLGAIPLARMSPATGAVFFLAGFAIFILILRSSARDRRTLLGHWAGGMASAVLVISFVFCGAYIYGAPLLYGQGATVPMALTTALGFLMLGSSIVGAAGIDAIPMRFLTGCSTYNYLLRFFIPMTIFSVLFGGFMMHYASTLFRLNMAIMQAIVTVLVVLITAYLTMRIARHLGDSIDQAEEALQASEAKFKTYILSAPDAIFVVDAVGRYIEVNEAACRLTGYTESELLKMFIPDIIDPQTSTQVLESLDIFKKTGSLSTEFRLKRKNGSVIWVSLEAVSLSAERFMAFCSDITERKQAEEALRESEARLSKAELISRVGHWDWDLISKDLTWSQGLCTLFGIDEFQFGGKYESFLDFVHPDDRQHVVECVDKAINGVQPLDHEHRIIKPDGTVRLIHATAEITFEHRKAIRMLGVARDITERRQAEEALRRSELELNAIYENAPLVMLLVDHERRIVKLNALAASMARRSVDEVVGLRAGAALRCVHAIDDPRGCGFGPACETCGVRNTILKTIQSGKAFHRLEATVFYDHTDGPIKIHVLVSTTPLRVSEENFVLVCLEDITERKQAEERAARFNRALEGSLNEIYIFNAGTLHFIEVNRGARENLGYSLEELRGLTPLDLKPEFTAESFAELVKPLRTGIKEKVQFTTVHRRKDGTQYPVEVHLQLMADGSPVFVAIVLDITERKRVEETLRESEEKFRTLTASSPVGMFLNDAQGKAIYVNEKCAELIGMPVEKALNFDWVSAIHPDDQERVTTRWARTVQNCEEFHMEYRWAYADGRVVWTLGDIVPVRGSDGEVAVYIGTLTDITERKQAEEALQESEERYRSLVENINLGIAVIDPQMRVLSMNKQFLEWFPDLDLSAHPICYQAFSDPPRERPCSCCPVIKTFAGGLVHESVSETLVRGEIKNYRITSTPLRDTDGNVIAVIEVVEDITDKTKLEEELNKADKLESIGVLAGGIAHDFNNILTSLLGNISLARMETNLTPGLAELLANAEKATSKAAVLTRQLLTFAKGGVPVLKTVSLEGIVRDTTEFALRGSNVKPLISFADDLRAVSADEGQISQVINNLVINANQAMPDGGTLQVHCRNYTIETRCALPLPAGDYVTITVADQGVGITPEHLAKIFDPFFTTKKTGNGLGLASSYSIIRKHNGHIEVESELGVGTTFTVYLPATLKETEQSEEVDSTIPRGSGRILILDDEETIRIVTEKTLGKLGYEVVTSEDGWATIELYRDAQQAGDPFAAVILDLTIPGGMGGRDVIGFLRKMNPEVKAIVASGYSNDPVLAEYREYGFSGIIVKPYTARTLGETLHNVLARTKVSV